MRLKGLLCNSLEVMPSRRNMCHLSLNTTMLDQCSQRSDFPRHGACLVYIVAPPSPVCVCSPIPKTPPTTSSHCWTPSLITAKKSKMLHAIPSSPYSFRDQGTFFGFLFPWKLLSQDQCSQQTHGFLVFTPHLQQDSPARILVSSRQHFQITCCLHVAVGIIPGTSLGAVLALHGSCGEEEPNVLRRLLASLSFLLLCRIVATDGSQCLDGF